MEGLQGQPLDSSGDALPAACRYACEGLSQQQRDLMQDRLSDAVLERSLIPPVPPTVVSIVRSGSRIPRPRDSHPGIARRIGRKSSEESIFSPKGMDPSRFASIRYKFEAMQIHAAKTYLENKALIHSQPEPAERAQRIAESLARLEQDFPQVGTGLFSRPRTAQIREDEETTVTVLRDYVTDMGMSTSLDLYDGCTVEDAEDVSMKRRSAGVHMSVSSLNHLEDTSMELEQNAQSPDTGRSHVSLKKKSCQGNATTQAGHKDASPYDHQVYMSEESDSVMMHLREEVPCLRSGPNHSDFVEDSAGRGLHSAIAENTKINWSKPETLHKLEPTYDECKRQSPCHTSPMDQRTSPDCVADVDRSSPPCSHACVAETRASYRRSLSRVSGSLTGGSFDSMWSLEVSDPCGIRILSGDVQPGPHGQVYSPQPTFPPKPQGSRMLPSPTENLDLLCDTNEVSQCPNTPGGPDRVPEQAELDSRATLGDQAKDLSDHRVLYWGSANERGILPCSAVDHSLHTLPEERSAHTLESDTNTNFSRSLVIESQTSSGIGYNSPRYPDKAFPASLEKSIEKDLQTETMVRHRWSVTALEELNASLGISCCCPQFPNSAREHGSKVVCHRSRTHGLAKYGFTFDLPEVLATGDIPLDGDVVKLSSRKDCDEGSNMEDSASTIICSTPLSSRISRRNRNSTLLSRMMNAMKLLVPRSGIKKRALHSEPTYHDSFGFDNPESPIASGCLPVRNRQKRSHAKRKASAHTAQSHSSNPGGTKKWWKSHCRKQQQIAAGCGQLGSQSDAKCPESSVHKYSRRHMFIMDKIENERLGKVIHPKRRVGQERELGWETVQTS